MPTHTISVTKFVDEILFKYLFQPGGHKTEYLKSKTMFKQYMKHKNITALLTDCNIRTNTSSSCSKK